MKRRGFLTFALGAPAGLAAAMGGTAVENSSFKVREVHGVALADLGAVPFPGAIRMRTRCSFSSTGVFDALFEIPEIASLPAMLDKLDVIVGHYDLRYAVELRRDLAPDMAVSIIVNRNRAWSDGRWAVRCAGNVVYNEGC